MRTEASFDALEAVVVVAMQGTGTRTGLEQNKCLEAQLDGHRQAQLLGPTDPFTYRGARVRAQSGIVIACCSDESKLERNGTDKACSILSL